MSTPIEDTCGYCTCCTAWNDNFLLGLQINIAFEETIADLVEYMLKMRPVEHRNVHQSNFDALLFEFDEWLRVVRLKIKDTYDLLKDFQ